GFSPTFVFTALLVLGMTVNVVTPSGTPVKVKVNIRLPGYAGSFAYVTEEYFIGELLSYVPKYRFTFSVFGSANTLISAGCSLISFVTASLNLTFASPTVTKST